MIDRLRSKERKIKNVHDFEVGELYLQHCQQRHDGKDSLEDILRIFRLGKDAVFGTEKGQRGEKDYDIVTLHDHVCYTTTLNPEKFDKGRISILKRFRISFEEDCPMGNFYHIHNGYTDIETLFGVHLQEHERMERATRYSNKVAEPLIA